MIGYTDRATRCSGSRNRIECSSTPAPSSGYMFWIAPIQTPIMPVRRSPKYFHVSESGPRGDADGFVVSSGAAAGGVRVGGIDVTVITASWPDGADHFTIMLTTIVVYNLAG